MSEQSHFRSVRLVQPPVELYKILKFEALTPSGGLARHVIEQGEVRVNGQVETRKRRKIVPGDVIDFSGVQLRMV